MIKMKATLLFMCICMSCCILKKDESLFRMKDAWYQSWYKSESEQGTTVSVELLNVKPGVEFDSIIFRHKQLPLFTSKDNNVTKLSTVVNQPTAKMFIKYSFSDKFDQLQYKYLGKRYVYPIKAFRRKD